MPWDRIEVDCPDKLRLAPNSADKWHAILIVRFIFLLHIFYIWGIVVWNIVKLFWFKLGEKRGNLPEGCQDKVPWENAIFFFFQPYNPTKYPFKEYRPHRPKSYVLWICLSETPGAAQPQKGLPCGLFTTTAGFMIEQKTDQTYCLELSAHMPTLNHIVLPSVIVYTVLPLFSFTERECHLLHLPSSFQPVPIFLLVYQRNQVSLLQSSLCLCNFLGFSFPKRENCGP